ncbi:MAG: DUF362 domain-containing protein [Candidatus Hermodarchaeia archaeon]|jgi:uncharacterized protein (DUF362 family)
MDSVALVKATQDFEKSLGDGLKLIGGFGTLQSPVVIKPNICTISDGTGYSVTSVKVVEAVVNLLLRENPSLAIRIVESDSQSKWVNEAFDKFGYSALAEERLRQNFDVACVNLSESPTELVSFEGDYFTNPELPAVLVRPGYVISVAQAKTHYLTFITGALKNLFGFLPRKDQGFYHKRINEVIVDLAQLVPPSLSVIDARVGVEGWNGPKTRQLDTFIIGRKAASIDATMLRVMGFDPENIRHVVEASRHNQGSLNPKILGEPLESVRIQFRAPKGLDSDATFSS